METEKAEESRRSCSVGLSGRALQRGRCGEDRVGDTRMGARAFDDSPGILAAENDAEALEELREEEINGLASHHGLRFGKLAEHLHSSWAPGATHGLSHHGAEGKALIGA